MTLHSRPVEEAREAPYEVAALFRPRAVAVIGASSNPARFGGKIIPSLQRHGYSGTIYPINPGRDEVNGLRCYPSLSETPGAVDCVVFGVAPDQLMPVLREAGEKGVRLVVVASAGFAEAGTEEGTRMQAEATTFARANSIRLLGPNCIGFANAVDRVFVSAAAALEWPEIPSGNVGVVSQSGGLGLATILYCALEEGIGFSNVISTGNEADLDTIDVARFLLKDPATDVIAMTIEAVKDAGAFLELLQDAGEAGKPVVVLKSGRSSLGKSMAASHTGALVGSSDVFAAVCRRYGVWLAEDVDDFYQIASMFAKLRAAGKLGLARPGRRVAALSLSGGHVGLFADHGSLAGLTFPPLSDSTRTAVVKALGFDGDFHNPLDVTAKVIGDDGFWGRCIGALLDGGDYDVVVPIITVAHSYEPAIRDFIALAAERPGVVLPLWAGGSFVPGDRALLAASPVPAFRTPARAAAGIAALDAWTRIWNDPAARPVRRRATPSAGPERAVLETARAADRATLTECESKEVLAAAGLPVTRGFAVTSAEEAAAAAREIGFPVVMKGDHPAVPHKSDHGLVLLKLGDEAAVRDAFATLTERLVEAGPSGRARVLVQQMKPPVHELILGMNTDPEFGPVLAVGLGGIFAEVLGDVALALPPVGEDEARRMIEALAAAPVLQGARGGPAADLDRLSGVVAAFSRLIAANADLLSEIDINPLAVTVDGSPVALDGLIVLSDPAQPKETPHGS